MEAITIHTDGSAWPNPGGAGGWAFVARFGDTRARRYGCCPMGTATNNRMELLAILHALRFVRTGPQPLKIVSDSKYCVRALAGMGGDRPWVRNWVSSGWVSSVGKPVANRDEIEGAYELLRLHGDHRDVSLVWTRGHSGTRDNEIADALASRARIDQTSNWAEDTDARTTTTTRQEKGERDEQRELL